MCDPFLEKNTYTSLFLPEFVKMKTNMQNFNFCDTSVNSLITELSQKMAVFAIDKDTLFKILPSSQTNTSIKLLIRCVHVGQPVHYPSSNGLDIPCRGQGHIKRVNVQKVLQFCQKF